MKFEVYKSIPLIGLSLLAFAGVASATPIVGVANIAGLQNVIVTPTSINFGTTFTQTSGTGSFASGVGTTGTVNDVLMGPPLTGAISVPQFLTFSTLPTINFDITNIEAGTGTGPCTGAAANVINNTCTPAGSPFTLLQGNGVVTISLNFDGISYTGTSGSGSSMTLDSYDTRLNIVGLNTISQVIGALASNGSVSASYSATLSATAPVTTPEPGSEFLMGAGLLGIGYLVRRRRAV